MLRNAVKVASNDNSYRLTRWSVKACFDRQSQTSRGNASLASQSKHSNISSMRNISYNCFHTFA
jgi:hypothetical protein